MIPPRDGIAGHPWLKLDLADSTQTEAWKALEAGAAPGLVVTARGQAAGRGREGRGFHSPPGGGLWASVTARLRLAPEHLPACTAAAAVAAAEALSEASGLEVPLRWPNDLMAGALKLGGVLAESRSGGGGAALLAIGIGVNLSIAAFPPELGGSATSVALAGGRVPAPEALLAGLLPRLDRFLAALEGGEASELLARWRERCRTLGRPVEARCGDWTVSGVLRRLTLTDITLETPAGERTLPAGHVTRLVELG